MKRMYHHYEQWEDFQHGMWASTNQNERNLRIKEAIRFTGNHRLYGEWMMNVIKEWPRACEQNLTNKNMNRRAWIGHAAACLAMGFPEDITREAWKYLSREQQDLANKEADKAIAKWEEAQNEKRQMRLFP